MWNMSRTILVSDTRNCHPAYMTDTGTGSWFAWANSVYAQTILDLAERKPHLLFGEGADPYIIE